jgi:hypothetical protein
MAREWSSLVICPASPTETCATREQYVAVLQVDLQPTSTVMTLGGGDALTGSALRGPSTHRAATRLFSSVKQLYTPSNGEKEVEFDFKVPEMDVRHKELPVSLHLGKIKASSLPSRGFCESYCRGTRDRY